MKLLLYLIFLPFTLAANKLFDIQTIIDCPNENDLPISFHVEINKTAMIPNRILYSGYLEAKEKIIGPIDMSYEINRCDLKSENCEKFTGLKIQGICKFLSAKNGLLSDLINAFKPPLKCPIMPGKYNVEDSSVDVSNFAILPYVGGFIWITTLKVTSTEGKNRKLAMCVRIDTKITNGKESRRGNRKSTNN